MRLPVDARKDLWRGQQETVRSATQQQATF